MQLNFPEFDFRIEEKDGKRFIFDTIRKKSVVLTPEEWVRQHIVRFLIEYKNFPSGLIGVEHGLKYNKLQKRADIVLSDRNGDIYMLVEVKAPSVKLNQDVLHQIAAYHKSMPAKLLLISNGLEHYCLSMTAHEFKFLDDIPDFGES